MIDMISDMHVVGRGFYYEDLAVGFRFRTHRRSICEADVAAFINLTWLTEELFAVIDDSARAIKGRPVPGAMVYSCAEGLLLPAMQNTGLAFFGATLAIKAPTFVGDTIHVECEVMEVRLTSKGDRGLVRTANKVMNQHGETVLSYDPLRMVKRRLA
jgi:acyl dehydratase